MNLLKRFGTLAVMLFITVCFLSLPILAQTSRGTITGTVKDPSGAVLPNATVTLTEKATNVQRETSTNSAGIYRFDAVNLGAYTLVTEAPGFAKSTLSNVLVQANRVLGLDFTLQVGTTDSVTVEASAGQVLQTTEQVRSTSIESRALADLPISGQNSLNLIVTAPGVIPSNLGGSLDSGIGSVNGSRARANNFMIDGVENNDISVAGPAITITNQDAIQEVSIQTSNFSAEFGRAGGAVINQITKSGTNSVHGTVAWIYLSEAMNASSNPERIGFDPNGTKPLKTKFKENIPAFTAGGPLVIPGIYNGKNRTFWFAAGQWDRWSGDGSATFTVPTAAGISTLQSLAPKCPNVQLYLDALGGLVAPTQRPGSTPINISIPNNVFSVTGSCNGTNRAGMTIPFGTALRAVPSIFNNNNHQVRFDHKISERQQLSVRWLYTATAQNNATIALSRPYDADVSDQSMTLALAHTLVISNRMTNEFRFNYGRINPQFPIADPSGPGATLPTFAFATLSGFGTSASFPQGRTANNWQYQDTMSLVQGRHQMRFGVDLLRQLARQSAPVNSRGSLAYNTSGSTLGTVISFANFIDDFAGSSSSPIARQFGSPVYRPNLFRHSYFFQDDWRLASTFTLNLGLRYENFGQPANIFQYPAVTFDPALFAVPNKINTDNNNFGPSIGFAWNPRPDSGFFANRFWSLLHGNGKMVIRGGFQTTYDTFFNNLLSNMAAANPNNVSNVSVVSSVTTAQPRGLSGLSARFAALSAAPLNPLTSSSSQFAADIRNPYTDRWSLGIQRELPGSVIMDLAYVGAVGRKLFSNWEANPFQPNATKTALGTRLNPAIGGRNFRDSSNTSNYNALQVEVRRNLKATAFGGIQFDSSYTWSRNMDTVSEVFATNSNPATLSSAQRNRLQGDGRIDYGPSDNDRRHRWVTTVLWDIRGPKNGLAGQILGGWTLGYIIPIQSGTPYHVTNGSDRDFDGATADLPDVGNWNAPIDSRGKPVSTTVCATGLQNIDTGACVTANDVRYIAVVTTNGGLFFSEPNSQTLRRNALWTTGQVLANMEILKKISISERLKLEYRAEIFNFTNTQNFNFVPSGTSVFTTAPGTFLDFSQGSTGNRTMRMGLKVIF